MADHRPPLNLPNTKWLDRTSPPNVITLVLIAGLGALNMNIFLPSLPSIADFYSADYALVQLAISGYLAMTAILQLILGPLSDRYGRRPVMIISLAVFLIASLACVVAPTISSFLFFRMVQAAVASGLVLSRAIVRDMVPADKAASMIGYVTMGMAIVPMIGPMIGGYLDQLFDFRASITFTTAFGAIVLLIVWRDLGETNLRRSESFSQQFRTYPELAQSRRFWGYALVAAFASGAFFAFLGGAPFVATEILGMTPGELGLYFGIVALGYMLGNYVSGRFSERYGINTMMLVGGIIAGIGLLVGVLLFAYGISNAITLFGTVMWVGIGNGLTLPSANAGIVSVRPELAGSASGLGGALMIGGGSGLSALTGSILSVDTGAYVLLLMMLLSTFLSILSTLYVIRRERELISMSR